MITEEQLSALKYIIFQQRDVIEPTKQLLSLLIDESQALTRDVCTTLSAKDGISAEMISLIAREVDRLMSESGSVYLNELIKLMGTDFLFSLHYGHYVVGEKNHLDKAGMFAGIDPSRVLTSSPARSVEQGHPVRYTFWLARKCYSKEAELFETTEEKLKAVDLSEPRVHLRT